MNNFNGIGKLAAKPEIKYFESGKCICEFSIYIGNGKDKNGEWRDSDFIPCKAWNATAELIAEHFDKNSQIGITGKLSQEKWEDPEGNKKSKIIVSINSIDFLDKKEG